MLSVSCIYPRFGQLCRQCLAQPHFCLLFNRAHTDGRRHEPLSMSPYCVCERKCMQWHHAFPLALPPSSKPTRCNLLSIQCPETVAFYTNRLPATAKMSSYQCLYIINAWRRWIRRAERFIFRLQKWSNQREKLMQKKKKKEHRCKHCIHESALYQTN